VTRVAIAGASGYVGGELLRLLVQHPEVEVVAATSERSAGHPVTRVHPHLRGVTRLKFSKLSELTRTDVLFLALPHGEAAQGIDGFAEQAERIVDCSADFRLSDPDAYRRWYGQPHPSPAWLERFVYGLPEHNRENLHGARYVSGVGCNATAVNLALLPLQRAGLLSGATVVADVKAGSSEGGAGASSASHHPERSSVLRSYAPAGHRHAAEVEQLHPGLNLHLSITSVDLVRGVLATCHVLRDEVPDETTLLRAWRGAVAEEPFVDVVHERTGNYRHPEPKLLWGTNRADLGFDADPARGRIVALAAIDNLGKGAAGSAVQCMNLALGLDETAGLETRGLHPV
jgi:N-acetyl-gamma-glutamyl-phosphate/LysW-gamma-L-alpha-aminoadipyl-6-phosphate reductase